MRAMGTSLEARLRDALVGQVSSRRENIARQFADGENAVSQSRSQGEDSNDRVGTTGLPGDSCPSRCLSEVRACQSSLAVAASDGIEPHSAPGAARPSHNKGSSEAVLASIDQPRTVAKDSVAHDTSTARLREHRVMTDGASRQEERRPSPPLAEQQGVREEGNEQALR